ncbi:MAG: hypothetical protein HUU56_09310 [Bdellovibrionaceae bacterium]|nr:hypothetical protein [Pseudobdellovibrionaceae bacterium]
MRVIKTGLILLITTSLWAQDVTTKLPVNNASVLTHPIPQTKESSVTYSGGIKVTTLGRSVSDNNLKSSVGWSFVEVGVDSKYFDWLSFSFNIAGVLGEGAAQNYLSDDGAPANVVIIDSIGLEVKPFKELSLKAGVIGYKINPILTTMTPGTSLGAEQKLEFTTNNEAFKLAFIGNEAIPSVGMVKGKVDEGKDPFFLAGTVQVDLKLEPLKTTLKGAATQFKFGNLPDSTAKTSLTGGNSINSVAGTGDQMHYLIGFAGIENAGLLETEWTSKFSTTLKAAVIENTQAATLNKGNLAVLSAKWKLGNVILKPAYTLFEIQADTTPSSYSILTNRYNNRTGSKVAFDVELEKQKLVFFGNYTKADVLDNSPFIFDREIYNLGVEVNYDLF